jgi:hypothetical protein
MLGARSRSFGHSSLTLVTTLSTSSRARGARRVRAGDRTGIAPREATADLLGGAALARSWLAARDTRATPGAGCLPLALRATSAPTHTYPRGRPYGQLAATSAVARAVTERAIPPGLHYEALQDHGQGRSLRSRRSAQTLDRGSCQGFSGAYRRNDRIRALNPQPCSGNH